MRRKFRTRTSLEGAVRSSVIAEEAGENGDLFLVQCLGLPDQCFNFFRCQFAGELGHVAFAVYDDVAKVFGGGSRDFVRNKRRPAKMAALGGFPMTFGAVFDVDGVREQTRVSGWSLSKGRGEREKRESDCGSQQ